MFSREYYDKLDPSYRTALRKLESDMYRPNSRRAQDALTDFAGKFMINQELWQDISCTSIFFYRSCRRNSLIYDSEFNSFFYKEFWVAEKDYEHGIGEKFWVQEDLLFPHRNLDKRMEKYETQINSFIPPKIRQRHEEMKVLYSKIKAAEGNVDEWFAALLEANDHQFVKDNVEIWLGRDLTDRKLWMKYIDYLWENDFKHLLETYSKCVRFFTDDAEIMNGYRQAAAQYGRQIHVPWGNPCSIEVYDNKFWDRKLKKWRRPNAAEQMPLQNVPLNIHFDGQNPAKPQFPFLSPTIRYILDNASGDVLQKLFKTCKWFRAVQPISVCYKFVETPWQNKPVEIKEQSIKSYKNSILHSNMGRLFISTVFSYDGLKEEKTLSNLIPMIYRCTAKYVGIWNQNLSLEELKFFIGNAVELYLGNVRDPDGKEFNLEDILQATPKIKKLWLNAISCSTETCEKFCELKFENKLDKIELRDMRNDLLDPEKFAEFVNKNCSSIAHIFIDFSNGNEEYVTRLRQVVDDSIKEKWNGNEKPDFCAR